MPRGNPKAREFLTTYLAANPTATLGAAQRAGGGAGVKFSPPMFYNMRQEVTGGSGRRGGARAGTSQRGRAAATAGRSGGTGGDALSNLVAQVRSQTEDTRRMRMALESIRQVVRDALG